MRQEKNWAWRLFVDGSPRSHQGLDFPGFGPRGFGKLLGGSSFCASQEQASKARTDTDTDTTTDRVRLRTLLAGREVGKEVIMDAFRKQLDALMGANRNGDVLEVKRNYWDRDVCRLYLTGLCPHDLFQLTVSLRVGVLSLANMAAAVEICVFSLFEVFWCFLRVIIVAS